MLERGVELTVTSRPTVLAPLELEPPLLPIVIRLLPPPRLSPLIRLFRVHRLDARLQNREENRESETATGRLKEKRNVAEKTAEMKPRNPRADAADMYPPDPPFSRPPSLR